MAVDTKFGLLLINQFVLGVDAYSMVFLLLMELTTSAHTSFAGNLAIVSFALGEILATSFAYMARDWFRLRWFILGYFSLTLPYLYFVPESSYWLFNKRKYHTLQSQLRMIATVNQRSNSSWLEQYTLLITTANTTVKDHQREKKAVWQNLMQYLPRLWMSSLISFTTMIVYFKISFGLAVMNRTVSPYSNTLIGAVVESIGYITASTLINTSLGRKSTLFIYLLSTSICLFTIPFVMHNHALLTIAICQFGKLTISGALCIAWIYAPELFPTSMRGLANGIFVFAGRIGAILAPIIETTHTDGYIRVKYFTYAALTLLATVVVYLLPETRNRSFHDENDDDSFRKGRDEATLPLQNNDMA